MKRLFITFVFIIGIMAMVANAGASSITLSAQTILDTIKSLEGTNAFSYDAYYYGIDRVYVKPIVENGATVQFLTGSTAGATIAGWSLLPGGSNYAGYYEFDGSAWNIDQNLITDVNPANIMQKLSGKSVGQVATDAAFTVNFNVNGGDYLNQFTFVVDGFKFHQTDESILPVSFSGGGLAGQKGFTNNYPPGYLVNGSPVPIPGAAVLMGSGLLGLVGFRWRCRKK